MAKRPRPFPTQKDLEDAWRAAAGGPAFIGPVGPPMELWVRDPARQAAWRKQVNLAPKDHDQ